MIAIFEELSRSQFLACVLSFGFHNIKWFLILVILLIDMVPSFEVQKGAHNYKIEVWGQYWVVNGQNYLKINLEFFCSRIFPQRPHILQSPGTMTQMYGNKQQSVSQAFEKPQKWQEMRSPKPI